MIRRITMIKRLGSFSLMIVLCCFQIIGEDLDNDTIFLKFLNYTENIYQSYARDKLLSGEDILLFEGIQMSSRIIGYSLGNLLKYARRGSENHKIWLMLERKTEETMKAAIDREGELRGWDRNFIEARKQRAWQQCMAAQQGWFNDTLSIWTNVKAEDAPNFFDMLRAGDVEEDNTNTQDEEEIQDTGVVSDEILGKWTWTHEYQVPHSDRVVRQKLVVDVQRAGTEEGSTAYGPILVYLYEGYVVEIENVTDERSQPLAAPGDLCWRIKYTSSHRAPLEDVLGYTFDSVLDRMGEFSIRLLRNQGILEIGRAKYYR
jgi:hypothetical protein